MSVCPPDLVRLVNLQSVQIEDPQALLSRQGYADIFLVLMLNSNPGLPNHDHSLVLVG